MKPPPGLLTAVRYGFVALAFALGLGLAASVSAGEPTGAAGNSTGSNSNPAGVQVTTPLTCTLNFADVPTTDPYYPSIMCLACQGIISGYPCGGPGEPCNENGDPYFRPNDLVTRGQIAKIVSISAGFNEEVPADRQTYADVLYGSTFWVYVERLASRGIMDGFACGGATEPCDWLSRPYFRPFENTNRGQLMKVVNQASHYGQGAAGKDGSAGQATNGAPQENLVTRAEASQVVANAFFPDCAP